MDMGWNELSFVCSCSLPLVYHIYANQAVNEGEESTGIRRTTVYLTRGDRYLKDQYSERFERVHCVAVA